MRRWGLVLLAGCGRIGFDSTGAGLGVDATGDGGTGGERAIDDAVDAMIDAPPGSMMTFTFGEAPITMIKNVTRDTFISNEAGETTFNYGGDNEVRIEADAGERALLAFDVSALPSTATIISASYSITVTQIPPAPLPIEMRSVVESWTEGGQAGADGVANYINRTTLTSWTTPGAGPTGSSASSFNTFVPVLGPQSITVPPGRVQLWLTSPATNFGTVMISTSNDSTRFTTSEGTPASARPVLTVTFTP